MIIDAKTVAMTSFIIAVAFYWGLGIVRKFALQIAQGEKFFFLFLSHNVNYLTSLNLLFLRIFNVEIDCTARKSLRNDETGMAMGMLSRSFVVHF